MVVLHVSAPTTQYFYFITLIMPHTLNLHAFPLTHTLTPPPFSLSPYFTSYDWRPLALSYFKLFISQSVP